MQANIPRAEITFLSGLNDKFRFRCRACGRCCGAFTVLLSTYDILRLKKATASSTLQLLEAGIIEIRRASFKQFFGFGPVADFLNLFGLANDDTVPIAILRFRTTGPGSAECPFLAETNENRRPCLIYDNRPTMCRLHPLGCATINGKRQWFVRKPLCETAGGESETVAHWISSARAKPFLAANAQFLDWMRTLLEPGTRFNSLAEYQRQMVERILYNFDSLQPPNKRSSLTSIAALFDHWRSSILGS